MDTNNKINNLGKVKKPKPAKKFTFKTDRPTGAYSSFYSKNNHIKLKGEDIGNIKDKAPHTIGFRVIKDDIMEDKNPNCTWKWIRLNAEFTSVDEAKTFVNTNFVSICEKYKLATEENINIAKQK